MNETIKVFSQAGFEGRYIVLAYGTTEELQELSGKLFNQLNLAILNTGIVSALVLVYEVRVDYVK